MIENNPQYKKFAQRLLQLMAANDVSITDLSKSCGVSYEMARRYTLGIAKPRDKKLNNIALYLQTTPHYLDHGIDEQPISSISSPNIIEKALLPNSPNIGIIESIKINDNIVKMLFPYAEIENISILTMDNDSMSPTIKKHDLLFIDLSVKKFISDGIYVFSIDQSLMIKRLQKLSKGRLAVLSDNDSYKSFEVNESDLLFYGKVLKLMPITFLDL